MVVIVVGHTIGSGQLVTACCLVDCDGAVGCQGDVTRVERPAIGRLFLRFNRLGWHRVSRTVVLVVLVGGGGVALHISSARITGPGFRARRIFVLDFCRNMNEVTLNLADQVIYFVNVRIEDCDFSLSLLPIGIILLLSNKGHLGFGDLDIVEAHGNATSHPLHVALRISELHASW